MTKAERLIYLMNMIKNRGPVLVSEMTAECGVSQRTIYRDLNSLARMNMPIHYKNGYRLMSDTKLPLMQLSPEDLDLIRYALHHNPLAGHPFFVSEFRKVEQKIVAKRKVKRRVDTKGTFLFDRNYEAPPSGHESRVLADFLKAIYDRRKVRLVFSDPSRKLDSLIPLAVRLRKDNPALLVTRERSSVTQEFPLGDIQAVKVTSEKFTRRPMDLSCREPVSRKNS